MSASEPAPADAAFFQAYDRVIASWPVDVDHFDVPTEFGVTRVNACGPAGAPPLVLLPGGGATSAVWFANVADLGRAHRVFAVDLMGDAGRSVPARTAIRTPVQLMTWLDAVLDGLGVGECDLAGHSYGGWIALTYALFTNARAVRAESGRVPGATGAGQEDGDEDTYDPRGASTAVAETAQEPVPEPSRGRVRRLVLLDPTGCFAGYRPGYLLHALPLLVRPSAGRMRRLVRWETRGAVPDQVGPNYGPEGDGASATAAGWLDVVGLGAELPKPRPVVGGRPAPDALAGLTLPVLVATAALSRAHDPRRVRRNAGRWLPDVRVVSVPAASHHGLPMVSAGALDEAVLAFLA